MDRKMIFVLLLSGYIFTKPVATQPTVTTETHISPDYGRTWHTVLQSNRWNSNSTCIIYQLHDLKQVSHVDFCDSPNPPGCLECRGITDTADSVPKCPQSQPGETLDHFQASTTSAISITKSPAPEHIIVETTPGPYQEIQHDISQSVMVVIIFAVIAGIIGIIVGSAILIKLLKRRSQRKQSILELETSETPKQTEGTEDPEQQPMTGDSTIQASGEVEDKTSAM